jgi:hypothetical protein
MTVDGGDVELRALGSGDLARLLTTYAVAVALAGELRAALAARGLVDGVGLVASISATERPVVHVELAGPAAGRLAVLGSGLPRDGAGGCGGVVGPGRFSPVRRTRRRGRVSTEGSPITSSAKVVAYELLATETVIATRPLSALVDAVACVLTHSQRSGREETARLALETITRPAVALAVVRALIGGRGDGVR